MTNYSPLLGFENARISFLVPDVTQNNSQTINSTGNLSLNTKQIDIEAFLKSASLSEVSRYAKEIQEFDGVDSYAILLQGYLVNPVDYPQDLPFLSEGIISLKTSPQKIETGRFKLLPIPQNPCLVALSINFLVPIIGIFRRG